MRQLYLTPTAALALLGGCGGATGHDITRPVDVAARDRTAPIALETAPRKPGEIVVRDPAAPADHGPYRLAGHYVARFEQLAPEDPQLDFSTQTPLVAHLEQPSSTGPGRRVRLLSGAARTGTARVTVPAGRWHVVVDFGDYPYVIRLSPRP